MASVQLDISRKETSRAPSVPRNEARREMTTGEPAAHIVGRLLKKAGKILATDRMSAKHLIDQAIALLNAAPSGTASSPGCLAPSGGLAPWQVRRVSEFVDMHLEASLSTTQLAAVVNLSTCYFCHAFKKTFGVSPHTYVMAKRMERAQELMLTTEDTLSQIAVACGLADQSHLSRVFRRTLGHSPSAWRRHYRIGHSTPGLMPGEDVDPRCSNDLSGP
jgi:AraC family transcriptional regulator